MRLAMYTVSHKSKKRVPKNQLRWPIVVHKAVQVESMLC